MAATTAMTTSFKVECFTATHNFTNGTGHVFKIVLIKTSMAGTYGAASTNYTDVTGNSDESTMTNYTTGGETLTNVTPSASGTTAITDFADVTISSATGSAAAAMIINTSSSNAATSVHDFAGDKTASGGDFVIQFPAADASNSILRIA